MFVIIIFNRLVPIGDVKNTHREYICSGKSVSDGNELHANVSAQPFFAQYFIVV